jgi:anti-sigma regulatory factor (Ser/Thr protein kinase)/DNA-binding CsgD family transcriptional regulator
VKSFYTSAEAPAVTVSGGRGLATAADRPRPGSRDARRIDAEAPRSMRASGPTEGAGSFHRQGLGDPCAARIAVYDAPGAHPRVEEIAPVPIGDYISQLSSRTYEIARAMGGSIPFAVVNEVVENFIHADFREPVVTILDSGDTIRFSDQGPGITEKRLAAEPGYTTATREMKRYIRGVGSGLPLARECLSLSGGTLAIEDNLGRGAVVTVTTAASRRGRAGAVAHQEQMTVPAKDTGRVPVSIEEGRGAAAAPWASSDASGVAAPLKPSIPGLEQAAPVGPSVVLKLTNRQKRVLALVMDSGSAGPSLVARELAIGLSTAYRDLARLEDLGHIEADESGKRVITEAGAGFLKTLLHE